MQEGKQDKQETLWQAVQEARAATEAVVAYQEKWQQAKTKEQRLSLEADWAEKLAHRAEAIAKVRQVEREGRKEARPADTKQEEVDEEEQAPRLGSGASRGHGAWEQGWAEQQVSQEAEAWLQEVEARQAEEVQEIS